MSYITPTDLTTLGYDTLPPNDELQNICDMASTIADNFCLQSLGVTTTDEFLEINSHNSFFNRVFQSYLPVTSITSVKQYYNRTDYQEIDPSICGIDNRLGCILIPTNSFGRVRINYSHGYDPIPPDIKRAVLTIAANLISDYKRRKQFNLENVSEMSDDGQKIKFFDTTSEIDIPLSAKKILFKYRKIR